MKSKIFNTGLIVLIALLTTNTATFAQQQTPAPAPAVAPKAPLAINLNISPNIQIDDKELNHTLQHLNIKMKKLQKMTNVIVMNGQKNIELTMKDLDKDLQLNLNDIVPSVAFNFNDSGTGLNFQCQQQDDKNSNDDNTEATRVITKSYAVDANDKLQINNLYGKVSVLTWDKKEFKIEVEIKVIANSADKSKQMLDNITINDRREGPKVIFETKIAKQGSSWGWTGSKNSYHKLEINYTIHMPAKNALDVTNDYGAIELPDLTGQVVINNNYGSVNAKSLSNSGNNINISYGSANIDRIGSGEVNVSYGGLNLGAADKVKAVINYSSAIIGSIITSGDINIKGGGFKLTDIDKNMKNLSVNSNYSDVKLGVHGDENADFDVTVHYGSFSGKDHAVIISKPSKDNWDPTTQIYKGHLGKGDNDKVINIISSYGSVKFDQ